MGFGAFEKIKCIFSIAPVGNLVKLQDSPDAVYGGTKRWLLAFDVLSVPSSARVKHRMHYTGRRVFPVHASGVA